MIAVHTNIYPGTPARFDIDQIASASGGLADGTGHAVALACFAVGSKRHPYKL